MSCCCLLIISLMEKVRSDKVKKASKKRRCCIKGCRTNATMGIPVHRFPKEENMLFKWIDTTLVKRVSQQTIVCGMHFNKIDYINLNSKKKRLKKNAIPSQNLYYQHKIIDHDYTGSDSKRTFPSIIYAEQSIKELFTAKEQNNPNDAGTENECENGTDDDSPNHDSVIHIAKGIEEQMITSNDAQCQTELLERNSTGSQTQNIIYSFLNFLKTDAVLNSFTGINFKILTSLENSIKLLITGYKDNHACSLIERIVLCLCKLRINMLFECLGILFKISRSTASNYFSETLHQLHAVLEEIIYFPTKEEILEKIPEYFVDFKDIRIVLDYTEIPVQNSKCLQCRLKMYSHYKGRQTFKFLIGLTPSGLISFHSKCYGGRASDKLIFLQSNLLQILQPGDAVMVDNGFLIQEECAKHKIKLISFCFKRLSNVSGKQFIN